jgi:hypothetical protein
MQLSEHQWTVIVVGACTTLGVIVGRILQRLEDAGRKHEEFEARRWHGERRLVLVNPDRPRYDPAPLPDPMPDPFPSTRLKGSPEDVTGGAA